MRDFTVINSGNCDLDESPILGIGHYVIKSTHKLYAKFYGVNIDEETGEINDNDGDVVLHVVPEDIPLLRFFLSQPSKVQIRTLSDCDWCFIQVASAEQLDHTPVEMPLGMDKPLTLRQDMMRFIQNQLSYTQESRGMESFEEANDFPDDDEIEFDSRFQSPYEMTDEQLENTVVGLDKHRDIEENKGEVKDPPKEEIEDAESNIENRERSA